VRFGSAEIEHLLRFGDATDGETGEAAAAKISEGETGKLFGAPTMMLPSRPRRLDVSADVVRRKRNRE